MIFVEIDFKKIEKIYGIEMLKLVRDNFDDITNNINYMKKLGFTDIEDIFERYTPIFICSNKEFKDKINNLVNKLGIDYVSIIENDLSILEELL